MRTLISSAILIALASSVAWSGPYIGRQSAESYRTEWRSKIDLETNLVCQSGHHMSSIAFKHPDHKNFTHEESFQIVCTRSHDLSNRCYWSDYINNFELRTNIQAPRGNVLTGVRFRRNYGENYTYQQEFSVQWCEMRGMNNNASIVLTEGDKFQLVTEFPCKKSPTSGRKTHMIGLGFSHPNHKNLTYQESVHVTCAH